MIFYRLIKVNHDGFMEHTEEATSFEQLVNRMEAAEGVGGTNLQYWIDAGWCLEWADIDWKLVDPDYKKDEAIAELGRIAGWAGEQEQNQ